MPQTLVIAPHAPSGAASIPSALDGRVFFAPTHAPPTGPFAGPFAGPTIDRGGARHG